MFYGAAEAGSLEPSFALSLLKFLSLLATLSGNGAKSLALIAAFSRFFYSSAAAFSWRSYSALISSAVGGL